MSNDPYSAPIEQFPVGKRVRIGATMYDYPTARNTNGAIRPGDTMLVSGAYHGRAVPLSRVDGTGIYLAWPHELTSAEDDDE